MNNINGFYYFNPHTDLYRLYYTLYTSESTKKFY